MGPGEFTWLRNGVKVGLWGERKHGGSFSASCGERDEGAEMREGFDQSVNKRGFTTDNK